MTYISSNIGTLKGHQPVHLADLLIHVEVAKRI